MKRRALILAAILLFAAAPFALPPFYLTLANYIGLAAIVTIGIVLLTGVGGMMSLAQASFAGVAAYTSAYLSTAAGLSPWLTLPIGLAATAIAAALIGVVTLGLSGHYLPVGTIAWSISLYYIFVNLEGLGGNNGITNVPTLSLFGYALRSGGDLFYLICLLVLGAVLTLRNLLNSRMGRAIRALRGGVTMIEAFGANTARLKMWIFLHAALLAGVAGWLYAHYMQFVNPTAFSLNVSIEYFFMAIIGGPSSPAGALAGASLFVVLKEILQDTMPRLVGRTGEFEIIVFGALVVLGLHYARRGLVPVLQRRDEATPAKAAARFPRFEESPPLARRTRPKRHAPILAVSGISKNFGGLIAVKDVSFTVNAGEIVGVIGPNGAGKSTLFNLLSGVLPPSGGQIRFLGREIQALRSRAIAELGVARSFQHTILRPRMTVLENVAIGAHLRGSAGIAPALLRLERREEAQILREAQDQLRRVGLGDHAHADARKLSLGQQRIVEIARTLAADPILVLLDEPAAGLRHHEKAALAALLRGLRDEGLTILLVEHDMKFVMGLVDRLVVMDFGEKIAEGRPEEIRSDPAVIKAYLGTGGAAHV